MERFTSATRELMRWQWIPYQQTLDRGPSTSDSPPPVWKRCHRDEWFPLPV